VGPGDVELGGGDVADAALGDQLWRGLVEQLLECSVVFVDLGVEQLDPPSEGSHRAAGGALMDRTAWAVSELRACCDLPGGAQSAELGAQRLVGGDDECLQLVDRTRAGAHRCGPGHGTNADRLASAVVSSRDAEPLAAEHLAGGAHGVQGVGLGAVFGLAGRSIELDDPLAVALERDGDSSPVAGGALDHPGPFAVDTVAVGEDDGFVVAVPCGWEAALGDDAGAAGVEHGQGDPVAVGVDSDHVIDEFCKHDERNLRESVSVGAGLGGTAARL
jgi:hypothetical protein